MSKQRPSKATVLAFRGRASTGDDSQSWRRRVFHNSYTRKNRRFHLGHWSVKLQFQGQRRTFRLAAATKSRAASEAREIHRTLVAQGWGALDRQARFTRGVYSKDEVDYWKARLLVPQNPFPATRHGGFKVRIEHAGIGQYFPLAEPAPEGAARKALAIYQAIVEKGWPAVQGRFAREVTLAVHWAYDPLLWTYTTVHTILRGLPQPALIPPGQRYRVLLLEPNPGLRNALLWCLHQRRDCSAIACGSPDAAARERTGTSLCLINRNFPDVDGFAAPTQLASLSDGIPVVTYSVHNDSDQVFLAPPGGISAYCLKRVQPEQILQPLHNALAHGSVSLEGLVASARAYFQHALHSAAAFAPASHPPALLTQREHEVLNLISKGFIDKEIAHALGISAWTVHGHVKRVFEKLHVHSRMEAVLAYLQK